MTSKNSRLLVVALGLVLCAGPRLPGATFTVTKTTDSGSGTLRQAITDANATTNLDTIVFNLSGGAGVKTISPLTPLPLITSPVVIDGWSQGGAGYTGPPLIELNGSAVVFPFPRNGLEFWSGGNTVRGLIINRFSAAGIALVTNGFNTIQGNYIGTDATGLLNRGNTNQGIVIVNSPGNVIGGTTTSTRNIISGNRDGIQLLNSGAHDNVIQGNYIGLNAAGTAAVPNQKNGILLNALSGTINDYPSDNTIGGSAPGARNIISGNGEAGVQLLALQVGPATGPTRNRIIGNFIGTHTNGMFAIPNTGPGIWLTNATQNTIGGFSASERNLISGNAGDGILMEQSRSNVVTGNFIGTDANGVLPLGNLFGVTILNGSFNTIGDLVGTGNVISANAVDGVQIGRGGLGNQVLGNLIGLDATGQTHTANLRHGVAILDSTNNMIGGAVLAGNYIVGNSSNGVFLGRGALNAGSVSNVVKGNTIAENAGDGVQLSGGANANQVFGNVIGAGSGIGIQVTGNFRHGVSILDSTNNLIGGASTDARNYISGNRSNGVFIGIGELGTGSVSNALCGNRIGTTPIGNGGVGVFVLGDWNFIGGTNTGEGNLIFGNGATLSQRGHGVVIASGNHNPILGNQIWGNSGRGIDLGNDSFTVNDIGDGDTGANDLQNYPVVTRVEFSPQNGLHNVTWTLNSKTNRAYRIEYFANSAPDPSGFGEGQTLVRSETHTTDADGFVEFTNSFNFQQAFLSVTATDLQDWNTSEFSPVDTDGDGIADAWETRGIDFDEDGTIDLKLPSADPMYKDIYVEIDAMEGRVPDMSNLARVNSGTFDERGRFNNDGFLHAPADKVQNPNGEEGILVHLELDETNLPFARWQRAPGIDEFAPFDVLKSNYFGTVSQRANTNALNAKRLIYRYCIFADTITNATDGKRYANGVTRGLGANDFFITRGTNSSLPLSDEVASTFMHELGHSLGLDHGGFETNNCKPNYHSVMNYNWSAPLGWWYPFRLDYSSEAFPTLNEAHLDENIGIGASDLHQGHLVVVGPHLNGTNLVRALRVYEVGPVDWNGNTNFEADVSRDINFTKGTNASPGDIIVGSEDWSTLKYYFLDKKSSRSGFLTPFEDDLSPAILEEIHKVGTGVGLIQFSQPRYAVGETGVVAVITVTRTFEVEASVSVSFSTFPGTATSGIDYTATNGVLNFNGSDAEKIFAVPIINDGVAEEPETVRLVLSAPTGGAELGPVSEATLTIIDDDPPGHFTVSNTNNSGAGSLRQAILDANSSAGLGIIDFNIPATNGLTISPTTALPAISNLITIDGTTQPGFAGAPVIELNGTSAGTAADGLQITAGHCNVRGLVINRFSRSGINLLNGGANHIEGCYLGLNRLGTLDQGNTSDGIVVQSPGNVIGGTNAAARNFISGNNGSGINLSLNATNNQVLGNVIGLGVDGSNQGNGGAGVGMFSSDTSWNTVGGGAVGARNVISGNNQDGVSIFAGIGNRVLGNYIGTDMAGTTAHGNGADGIKVSSGSGHIIGGKEAGAGNVISGNGSRGIDLGGTASLIQGNRIGTDASGTNPLPNATGGITVSGANHKIGDTNRFGANTVAFKNGPGVSVPSAVNITIRGNSIFSSGPAGSGQIGIDLGPAGPTPNDTGDADTGANQLQNYPILTSASNSLAGTSISGSLNSRPNTNYTIDFYANAAPNPNGFGDGQFWIGSASVTTDTNGNAAFNSLSTAIYLQGRYITATATDPAGNTSEFSQAVSAEVSLEGRTFTVINTNDSGEGSLRQAILDANANVSERDTIAFDIPGSGIHTIRPLSPLPVITDPVLIDGYTQPGSATNTTLTGDNAVLLIELDGTVAGVTWGLRLQGGNSIVRGLVINRFGTGAGNSDGGSVGGIEISKRGGNRIEGNFIGTDPTGMLDRGNILMGISVTYSSSNVIGGILPDQRNIVSGTEIIPCGPGCFTPAYGINCNGVATGNRIEGNLIGTAADGVSAIANGSFGILVPPGGETTNTTIGGTAPGSGNVIAFNGLMFSDGSFYGGGIADPGNTRGTAILGNSIHSNLGLGIQGNLVNAPEGRGNFPFLSSAVSSNSLTTIQGRLNSVSNAPHRIEFFANETFDPSGFGEGKNFLGATNVPTDSNGFVAFTAVLPVAVSNGTFITATATDDLNNTSEFSPRLTVGDVLTNVIVVNSVDEVDDGVANATHTSLREAIMAANNHPGPDTIRFAITGGFPPGGAKTIGVSNSPPALMDAGTTIDATTQPGFAGQPLIYLNGLGLASVGFRLYSPSNTVRGFAINQFSIGIYGDPAFSSPSGGFNVIEGNYIGTDLTGAGIGPQNYGIYLLNGCPSNRIGGATAAARNVISGNVRAGVFAFGSDGNTFAGNFIGTDRTGTNAAPNGWQNLTGGMFIQRCRGTVIGGSTPGARNVISGNISQFGNQLFLWDDCSGSVVEGNFIGTDVTGRTNLGTTLKGIDVVPYGGILIKSNLICGFPALSLNGPTNRVEGNFIGTDATGTRSLGLPNGLIIESGGVGNIIGGTNAGSRNLISAGGVGITIRGQSNIVQGNYIGTKIDGVSPLGNGGDGVLVQQSFNQIGGIGPDTGNTIAFNAGSGVLISAGAGNAVLGNSIFSNAGLGIDLGLTGVTVNDLGDLDVGANNLQNFPILTAARNIGSSTILQGTLNSRSNTSFRIEFFSNTNCHPSGFGQGRTFLNATTVTTDASGNATIFFTHPAPVPAGQFITATATDPNNNTSEFSPCMSVINETNYVVLSFTTFNPYTLSWPTSALNFSLERATNLTPPVIWLTVSNSIATNGGNKVFVITNDPLSPVWFFRLRKPRT